jgi:hypothetical protein
VHLLAGRGLDDLLAVLAHQDALARQLRVPGGHPQHVARGRVGAEAEEQVGRGQVEEVQGVGLEHLAVVHQPAHLLGGGGELLAAHDPVDGLGRAQVVADGADAAQALYGHRHLPERTALDEALEAAELDDVQARLRDPAVVVEQDGDLAVPLDAGDRLDDDALAFSGHLPPQSYLMSS